MSSEAGNLPSATLANVAQTRPSVSPPDNSVAVGSAQAIASGAAQPSASESIASVAEQTRTGKAQSLDSLTELSEEIKEAIATLNNVLERSPTKAIIFRDDQLNRYIVKIADKNSGEIIREIPSEAMLKFARNLREIKGLLFDKAL